MKRKIYRCVALFLCVFMVIGGNANAKSKKMSVKLNKKNQTVYIGGKIKLKATIQNKKKNTVILWKSTKKKVATVSKKGVVTGKKSGKTKIKATIKGTKITAVCVVTVKKKGTKPEVTTSPDVTAKPEASASPETTGKPEVSASPEATVKPEESMSPEATVKPEESVSPDATKGPEQNVTPDVSLSPTVQPSTPVVAVNVEKRADGEVTVFVLDRTYEGTIHIEVSGKSFTASGKVKDALTLLKNTYTEKTNGAGTVKVSREYPRERWEITDLETNTTYTMWVESKLADTKYQNCGAIYFDGDVTSVISVY